MFRFVCFLAFVAACNAGIANYNGAAIIAPTVTSEHQNVLRSYGNLQQVAYNSKSIETPYSSVHKSDVRVSNPGYQVHKPIAYAAPSHTTYVQHAAPAYHQPAAVAYHQPAVQTYHQPAVAVHHQPAVAVHHQPAVVHSAPIAHHQPAIAYSAHAAPATKTLLGVAYSPANVVSHMSYSAPLVSYGW